MSSVLATELYAPERTERVVALPTDAYQRPRPGPAVPVWCERTEAVIRAVGRFGLGPLPCVVVGFTIALGASLR